MTSEVASPLESCRVIVVTQDGEEILLHVKAGEYSLPQLEIPRDERTAPNLNLAAERDLGIRAVSLYRVVPRVRVTGVSYHAITALSRQNAPSGTAWKFMRSLSANQFSSEEDFDAIQTFQAGVQQGSNPRETEPFLKPDWFAEVTRWIEDALHSRSLRLTGRFEQFNADSAFSLIRFETNRAPVWFKAVGAPNLQEFRVTLALAQLCPARLPKILASKTEWNAWLSEDAAGATLSARPDARLWEDAAAHLADLQIRSIAATHTLRVAECRVLGFGELQSLVEPFFRFFSIPVVLTSGRVTDALSEAETDALIMTVQRNLRRLHRLSLPDAIGHMDLNPANIVVTDAGCVFLDWAEAFLGNPLFSFEYLLQHFRNEFASPLLLENRFRDAYLKPWRALVSPQDLQEGIALAPLGALFAYAAALWSASRQRSTHNITQERYLAGLVRKMRRLVTLPQTESVRP